MTKSADLHIHTHYSDGTMSPEEVVADALHCGIHCIAITDHDTIDGISPAIEAAKGHDLEVLPGIELSSEVNGKDVHMLGYLFNWRDASLLEQLKEMQNARAERMKKMIQKLEALGIHNISFEEINGSARTTALGRPHLAAALVEKKVVGNMRAAFDKYLAEGAPAYVPKFKQTPQDAIKLIKGFGGIAVLAHPMLSNVDELIPALVAAGLGGLEAHYPNCSVNVMQFYEGLARKHHLVVTGGSDAHGAAKKHTFIGKVRIPYDLVEKLKEAAQKNV